MKLSTLQDISLEKERCRYDILLQEQALNASARYLRSSFKQNLRNSMAQFGSLVASALARRIIQSRMKD